MVSRSEPCSLKSTAAYGIPLNVPTYRKRLQFAIRQLFHRFGLEVRRVDSDLGPSPLEIAATGLLSERKRLNIVQIGANDGRFGDPIFPFTSRYPDRTRVLLIEPQFQIIPFLEENYAFHPSKTIANVAVGPEGTLSLYSVDQTVWPHLKVPYAFGWPEYRAPTGVTSANKEHVTSFLDRYCDNRHRTEDAVIRFEVESKPLIDVIDESDFGRSVDVLQVDAEGADDEVLYHSSIDLLLPPIINFENQVLVDTPRGESLDRYLRERDYILIRRAGDTLCLRTSPTSE